MKHLCSRLAQVIVKWNHNIFFVKQSNIGYITQTKQTSNFSTRVGLVSTHCCWECLDQWPRWVEGWCWVLGVGCWVVAQVAGSPCNQTNQDHWLSSPTHSHWTHSHWLSRPTHSHWLSRPTHWSGGKGGATGRKSRWTMQTQADRRIFQHSKNNTYNTNTTYNTYNTYTQRRRERACKKLTGLQAHRHYSWPHA